MIQPFIAKDLLKLCLFC